MLERSSMNIYINYNFLLYTRVMAIAKKSSDDKKIVVEIDNGDFQALKEIKREWGFSNETNVLRFGLAVLSKAKGQTVFIIEEDGTKSPLSPADSLLNKSGSANAKEDK